MKLVTLLPLARVPPMMCQKLNGHPMLLAGADFHFAYSKSPPKQSVSSSDSVYDAWLQSRALPGQNGGYLVACGHRSLTTQNSRLAYIITKSCAWDLLKHLWCLHPVRTTLMMSLNILQGILPAFRGYSQAMIIDEVGGIPLAELYHFLYSFRSSSL